MSIGCCWEVRRFLRHGHRKLQSREGPRLVRRHQPSPRLSNTRLTADDFRRVHHVEPCPWSLVNNEHGSAPSGWWFCQLAKKARPETYRVSGARACLGLRFSLSRVSSVYRLLLHRPPHPTNRPSHSPRLTDTRGPARRAVRVCAWLLNAVCTRFLLARAGGWQF